MATWAATDLFTPDDLRAEIPDYANIILSTLDANKRTEILERAKVKAKTEVRGELLQALPSIFANSQNAARGTWPDFDAWQETVLTNDSEPDAILDYLYNPEELTECAVACFFWKLYDMEAGALPADYADRATYCDDRANKYKKYFEKRYMKAMSALCFDLNQNGAVDTGEQVSKRGGLRRV